MGGFTRRVVDGDNRLCMIQRTMNTKEWPRFSGRQPWHLPGDGVHIELTQPMCFCLPRVGDEAMAGRIMRRNLR